MWQAVECVDTQCIFVPKARSSSSRISVLGSLVCDDECREADCSARSSNEEAKVRAEGGGLVHRCTWLTKKKTNTLLLTELTYFFISNFSRENQNRKTFNSDVINCKMFSFKSLHRRCKCDVQTYLLHGHSHLDFLPLSFYIEPSPALLHHCFLIYHLKVQN